ncbi:hypothetical protein WAI453_005916 [Rhynchosporium graminicola]|uniref:Essential protein Yae1 N-terminal domain-containing protein n=1 Tax=Rhynchosporium graminicola TaxID=2792576 RepID=A0A1E1LR72_9HELO|nr:uncharacterized protein RCO7_04281 [Rhynchosporium commune]
MASSTFDEVLGLEEQFYLDGFNQGREDGVKAGRIEGRTFGLEKGFEKYIESGRLYGKSIVWANRMPHIPKLATNPDQESHAPESQISGTSSDSSAQALQPSRLTILPDNQRLAKHLRFLHALAESESLSTENSEEAVSDFDDRLKRAQGKAKIIERIVGEHHEDGAIESQATGGKIAKGL